MVVDYDRDKITSPLFLSHRVMDAIEMAVGRGLVDGNAGVAPRTLPTPETMAELIKEATRFYNNAERYGYEGSGRSPEGSTALFDRSCYIELSFGPDQLRAIRRYIRLNPARALWKQRHPDRFKVVKVATARLFAGRDAAAPAALPPTLTALRQARALRAAAQVRPLGRRLARTRRRPARDRLAAGRDRGDSLARHQAEPVGRPPVSAELPRNERPRRGTLRGMLITLLTTRSSMFFNFTSCRATRFCGIIRADMKRIKRLAN